jgi:two-component system, sensor histidine kinase YesM
MFRTAIIKILYSLRSIQVKIFLAIGIVTIFSMSFVTINTYLNSSRTIQKNAINYFSGSIRGADDSLNSMLEDMSRISAAISINKENVIDIINNSNTPVSYEWFQDKKRMENFMNSLKTNKSYIDDIIVVDLKGNTYHTGDSIVGSSITKETWVENVLSSNKSQLLFGVYESQSISIARPILYEHRPIGFVLVGLNTSVLKNTYYIEPLKDSTLFVVNEHGQLIYSSNIEIKTDSILDTPYKDLFLSDIISSGNKSYKINGKNYLAVKDNVNNGKIITIGIIPKDNLIHETIIIRNQMSKIIVIVLFLVVVVTVLISTQITRNLKSLRDTMQSVKSGNLAARPKISTKDEVGQLSEYFIEMMDEMHSLMESVKEKEKQKNELEIKALQSQIEPHFIYNTLNTIKYLANLQNMKNIEEITSSLVELLRSVLGNTNQIISIQEELQYVKSYILIQRYKFLDSFQVDFDVDENILKCKTIKLVLQPIVENAFIHGITSMDNGKISIKIYQDQQTVKFEVIDNGIGMDEQKIEDIFSKQEDSKSRFNRIGVKNVDERIKLLFGDEYGLSVLSSVGVFTRVVVTIPLLKEGSDINDSSVDCG